MGKDTLTATTMISQRESLCKASIKDIAQVRTSRSKKAAKSRKTSAIAIAIIRTIISIIMPNFPMAVTAEMNLQVEDASLTSKYLFAVIFFIERNRKQELARN